jgi:radical SAM superfamily enzyme YgiQ (UPF0313 family)
MARVTLISPYPNLTAFGLRTISAHLKAHGHHVDLVFLPDSAWEDANGPANSRYPDGVHYDLAEICAHSDCVGISVMTNFFDCAVELTENLKQNVRVPVIWGGVHPTVRPKECLEHADMVCLGEGEETTLQIANRIQEGKSLSCIPNLVTASEGPGVKPTALVATEELDSVPPPDLGPAGHLILRDGRIRPLSRDLFEGSLLSFPPTGARGYQTMTGRGCPHGCTYCANRVLKANYCGRRYLRWRSTEHVMAEFRRALAVAPSVGFVWLADDAFFARTSRSIRDFCDEYKKNVGLPFSCLASPTTVTEEKLEILCDAGLVQTQMGIESGSPRTQALYDRKAMSTEKILRAATLIHRFSEKMYPPHYDFIVDNPYESPEDEALTLDLISRLPKPFRLHSFSLVFYPGTDLHDMARKDGLITDERREIYARKTWSSANPTYYNLVMQLASGGRIPTNVMRLLARVQMVRFLSKRAFRSVFWVFTRLLTLARRASLKLPR